MFWRTLVLTATLLACDPTPLRASDDACFQAPTQACVLQLAFRTSDALTQEMTKPVSAAGVRGLIHTTLLLEATGSPQSDAALTYLLQDLPARLGSPKPLIYQLRAAIAKDAIDTFHKAPVATAAMLDYLLERVPDLDGQTQETAIRNAASYISHLDDPDQLLARVILVDPELRVPFILGALSGVAAAEDIAAIKTMLEMIEETEVRHKAMFMAVLNLIEYGFWERARHVAASIDSVEWRVASYQKILNTQLRNGQLAEARAIADFLLDTFDADAVTNLRHDLEWAYARLGDEDRVRAFLRSRTKPTELTAGMLLATVAAAQGDLGRVFDYLDIHHADANNRSPFLQRTLVSTYLAAGHTDLTPIIEHFARPYPSDRSGEDILRRLEMLGWFQAERGDLGGALFTVARADFVRDTLMEPAEIRPFNLSRQALERLMAERGMASEAVQRAYDRGDGISLVQISRVLD